MSSQFTIDEDRSEQLPSVEEVRMNNAMRRQSNASFSKGSDIETASSRSAGGETEHDQLPSVDDIRLNNPGGRPGRCRFFFLAAFLVVAAIVVTVALVVTKAGTDDDFNMMRGETYEDFSDIQPDQPVVKPPAQPTTPPTDTATTPPKEEEVATTPPKEESTPVETVPPTQPEEPTTPPTQPAPPANRQEAIVALLSGRGVSTVDDMSRQGSPQQRAVNWIVNNDVRAVPLEQPDSIVQRYIMTVFFYSMGGESWTNRLNFLSKEDECKWYIAGFAGNNKAPRQFGVSCNDQGTVQKIHFPSNFLSGSFPMELNKLTDLERLEVFNNGRLTGGFPEFLRGLPKISYIGLHYCGLQGELPDWLGSLTSLKSLVLSNNEFTGSLPASTSQLVNLEDLYLDDNFFSGGIEGLRGLSKLQNLVMEDNEFEGALDEDMVNSWGQLRVLDASHNQLKSTIPAAMFALPHLRILDLHSNQLFGALPKPAAVQMSMEMITLNENSLSGAIPSEISLFVNLNTLDLSGNFLTSSITSSLGSIANLEYLFLAKNDFDDGPIPDSFANLKSLKQLSLKSTRRTGSIPDWIGNLSNLILLDLDMNQLQGAIPDSLGNCYRMEYLLLNRNQLEGSVPASLSSMMNLKFFMIDQNKMTGSANAVCNYPQNVEMFIADCQGMSPEIDCPCCNVCCSDGNQQCNDDVWLGDSNPIWELGFERPGVELDASASRSYTVQFTGDIP